MRRTAAVVLSAAAVLAVGACAPTKGEQAGRHEVRSTADGDTLTLDDGSVVRLDGINAPEQDECLADRARDELARLVADGVDVTVRGEDRYGRKLGELRGEEGSVNEILVLRGLAVSTASGPDPGRIRAAEDRAREAGVGIWDPSACGSGPLPPVAITALDPDPRGADGEPGSDEQVVVEHTGGDPVDLSGWILRDESSVHRYTFPEGTRLAEGSRITVSSTCRTGTPATLPWCSGAVWNNSGDTAFLLEPGGRIVSWLRFAP